jgi:hypothetical protein
MMNGWLALPLTIHRSSLIISSGSARAEYASTRKRTTHVWL